MQNCTALLLLRTLIDITIFEKQSGPLKVNLHFPYNSAVSLQTAQLISNWIISRAMQF